MKTAIGVFVVMAGLSLITVSEAANSSSAPFPGPSFRPAVPPHMSWTNSLKPRGKPGPILSLASVGRTDYVLLLPATPTTQEEKAASDLAWYLKEITGAEFPIVREGSADKLSDEIISLGATNLLARSNLPEAALDLGDEGYAIAVGNKTVYLLGGRKRGPINAVYALLEEDLGCRWYDRQSRAMVPHVGALKFAPAPRHFVPVLELRDPSYRELVNDGNWELQNKVNGWRSQIPPEWGGRTVQSAMRVHTFNALLPPKQYFDKHPEYYSEIGGKRQPRQPCLTNSEVLDIVIANVRKRLREFPDSNNISVSPNDGRGHCECRRCKAIDDAEGTKAGTLLQFVNKVAEAVEEEFPNVRVSTLAYEDTTVPPRNIRPRHNVMIQLCTDRHAWTSPFLFVTETDLFQNAMKGWEAMGAVIHMWDYTSNYSHYLIPMPNMQVVAYNLRFFVDHKATGVMLQGDAQSPGGDNATLRSWVWAKQLWDPSRDTSALMRDFIYGYYGEAAEPIWKYNSLLWDIWEVNHSKSTKPGTSVLENPLMTDDIRYPPDTPFLSGDFLPRAMPLFLEAERLAREPETLRRVRLAKLPVLYVALCQGIGYVTNTREFRYGAAVKSRQAEQLSRCREMLDEFEQTVKREGISHFREGSPDAAAKIAQWKEVLSVKLPEISFIKIGCVWKFKPDPTNAGVGEKWYSIDTDDTKWSQVRGDLGHGWEKQGFPNHAGYGWYRQQMEIPADLPDRKFLYLLFGAVDEDAEIYINGEKVFDHTCGSTGMPPEKIWKAPFMFDVKSILVPGRKYLIAVRVFNRRDMGGIWKPVYLISTQDASTTEILSTMVE